MPPAALGEIIANLPPELLALSLPPWMAGQIQGAPDLAAAAEARLRAILEQTDPAEIVAMQQDFARAGEEWRFYPADPLARRLSRAFMPLLLQPEVEGAAHLDAFLSSGPRRRMIVCNHLSYTDTQTTDAVLASLGYAAADRLTAIAGPKVYTDPWRRVAAISLNTRKTPQSGAVATELNLPPREVARIALDAIDDCARLMDEGWIILLYPEGTRSRDGRLQPFLRAAARYCSLPDLQILPLAQTGTDRVFPRDESGMYAGAVRLRFGAAIASDPGKTATLDRCQEAVGGLM